MSVILELELTNDVGEIASIQPIPDLDYTQSGKVIQIDITVTGTAVSIFYRLEGGGSIREDIKRD